MGCGGAGFQLPPNPHPDHFEHYSHLLCFSFGHRLLHVGNLPNYPLVLSLIVRGGYQGIHQQGHHVKSFSTFHVIPLERRLHACHQGPLPPLTFSLPPETTWTPHHILFLPYLFHAGLRQIIRNILEEIA
jgi:hypothetical protein